MRASSLPMNFRLIFPTFVLILCALGPEAWARTWTTVTGQHFAAEFVRVEGANGIFSVKGKDYPYPLNQLSIPDRLFVGRSVNQQSKAGSPPPATEPASTAADAPPSATATPASADNKAGTLQFAGQPLEPGRGGEVDIPIVDPAGLKETQHAYGKPSAKARMLIAVPRDFDPAAKSYPLLIETATADGKASSIASCYQFLDDALGRGFVVMAVDGEFGKPTVGDPPSFRWALVAAGRTAMEKDWPGSKKWPVATGGNSGGGGYASYNALKLVQERADFIGLFLGHTNWNPAKFVKDVSGLPVSVAHKMPIFLSAGDKDEVVPRKAADQSQHEMEHEGFKNLRYEHFDGGHQFYRPHLQAALDWFLEEKGKSGSSPSPFPSRR